jgi:hypothetical protein
LNSTVSCSIRDSTGKSLPVIRGGNQFSAAGGLTPVLKKDDSVTEHYTCGIINEDGRFVFYWKDGYTNSDYFGGLAAGKYQVVLTYHYDNPLDIPQRRTFWIGHAEAIAEIFIRLEK